MTTTWLFVVDDDDDEIQDESKNDVKNKNKNFKTTGIKKTKTKQKGHKI